MKFSQLEYLDDESKVYAEQLDSYREIYDEIELQPIFEPLQIREVNRGKMSLIISCVDDLRAWQKEMGYGNIVKMKSLEDSILRLMFNKDLYACTILIRQHMELCGLLALSLDTLRTSLKENNFEALNKFISKTWFGTSFYNNPKLRDTYLADMGIETVTVSAMIKALDKFIEEDRDIQEEKNLFVHNYAWLCQVVHPSTYSYCFFNDALRVDEGHNIQFRWNPEFGHLSIPYTLRMLGQNLMIGLASYFVFMAYTFLDDWTVIPDEDKINYSFYKILNRFNKDAI